MTVLPPTPPAPPGSGSPAAAAPAAPPPASLRQALALAALGSRRLLATNLLLRGLQGALPLLGLVAMQRLLDAVARGLTAGATAPSSWPAVQFAVLFAAIVAAVGAALGAIAGHVGERHARRCADRCADLLARHAASLDLLQIESPAIQDQLHRAAAETQRPVRVVQNLAALALAAATVLTMATATAMAAFWLPLVVSALAIPQAIVRRRASQDQLRWQEQNTESQRELGYLAGLLLGRPFAKDLRARRLGEPLAARTAAARTQLTDAQLELQRRRTTGETFAQLLAAIGLFGAYLWLAHTALLGELTIGALLLQVQALQRTQNGVRDGVLAWSGLADDRLFLGQLFSFLATAPRLVAIASPKSLPAGPPVLACRGLAFAYPGAARPVFTDLELQLAAGERLLVTGDNGAGKSTLLRLLCRLVDPDRGSVSWSDRDLRDVDPPAVRARTAICFQDGLGLELSARDNLAFGSGKDRDAALLAVADELGFGDVLRQLPAGLDTRLGRGFAGARELSQGQWRRLQLVRAFATEADLLLLDEPFAFLDPSAQQRLAAVLRRLPRTRTVVVVDHGSVAADWADRELHLGNGRAEPRR